MDKQLKVALPKGRLLAETANLLQQAGWRLNAYHEGMRSYRLKAGKFPNLLVKVFHEKDIPIQVAVGNYDLGICGLDWVEELLARYPSSALVKLRNLEYGEGTLCIAASPSEVALTTEEMPAKKSIIRIASEYPNLAESFALNLRLRRFSIFPLWGAAEVYPPETADLALISGKTNEGIFEHSLVPVDNVLSFSAYLIANSNSWQEKDLSQILASIDGKLPAMRQRSLPGDAERTLKVVSQYSSPRPKESAVFPGGRSGEVAEEIVRLALPDGHQQLPTLRLLDKAGIRVDDYSSPVANRRPATNLDGVSIKVIRPQDMPLQVANGNFDIAITGRDWLTEHLYQFPSSPVTELLDLKSSKVRIVAVVSNDLEIADINGLRRLYAERSVPIRVASEYVNIADKYARDNHLGIYRVIPTWGATEAFLPEDADLLIENTETGRTIARHNLKIIDTLSTSTACLIGNNDSVSSSAKGEKIASITETLRAAVEDI